MNAALFMMFFAEAGVAAPGPVPSSRTLIVRLSPMARRLLVVGG